ncbi:MAG TPA: hypothetical protein VIC06_10135 [Solirubrobacteraceae bacterium]|jgi:hypothetical protein
MLTDLHQHLWSEPLIEALARRLTLPFVRRERGLTVLHLAGESPYVIDQNAEAPARRAAQVRADGIERALVCLSSTIGIEALPREEAQELLDAYHEGAFELPSEFGVWGAVALEEVDPEDVDRAGEELPLQRLHDSSRAPRGARPRGHPARLFATVAADGLLWRRPARRAGARDGALHR